MIKCHDSPLHSTPSNPYPDQAEIISTFRYDTALVLLRLRDAPQMRSGADADYLTGQPYQVSWCNSEGDDRMIIVPAGMITDLTSVPWGFRWLVGRVGPWLEAAIVHDYLYLAWQDLAERGALAQDRAFADKLMLKAMEKARVRAWRRWAIYLALRAFGSWAYRKTDSARFVDLNDPAIQQQLPDAGRAISG